MEHKTVLDWTTTVSEVSKCWGKSRGAVTGAILRGDFTTRMSGGIQLIAVQDVIDRWGNPIYPLARSHK